MLKLLMEVLGFIKQDVRAFIYNGPSGGESLEIVNLKESNGVWSVNGPRSWEGCYYVYEVSVYHPSTLKIEKCIANDPYARGYVCNFTAPSSCVFAHVLVVLVGFQVMGSGLF